MTGWATGFSRVPEPVTTAFRVARWISAFRSSEKTFRYSAVILRKRLSSAMQVGLMVVLLRLGFRSLFRRRGIRCYRDRAWRELHASCISTHTHPQDTPTLSSINKHTYLDRERDFSCCRRSPGSGLPRHRWLADRASCDPQQPRVGKQYCHRGVKIRDPWRLSLSPSLSL